MWEILHELGAATIKYTMFIFNIILVVTGITLICLGVIIKGVYTDFDFMSNTDSYISAANMLIVLGIIVFFYNFIGCWGAMKGNDCLMIAFAVITAVIFVLEIAIVITGYYLSDKTEDYFKFYVQESMKNYTTNEPITLMWDKIQTAEKCCGYETYNDWANVTILNDTLPSSCCHNLIKDQTCDSTIDKNHLYQTGCGTAILNLLSRNAVVIGAGALCVLLVQVLGVIFSCCLANNIRQSRYESV